MNYIIKKISIDEDAANLLINEMAAKIRNEDESKLDKRPQEFIIEGEIIDVVFTCGFNSDYKRANGGIQCTERGVTVSIKFYLSEKGDEIECNSPVALEEELQKIFWI